MLTTMFGNHYSTDATLTQKYPGDFIVILGANQAAPDANGNPTTNSTSSASSSSSNSSI
jgi:hypothetical protein